MLTIIITGGDCSCFVIKSVIYSDDDAKRNSITRCIKYGNLQTRLKNKMQAAPV